MSELFHFETANAEGVVDAKQGKINGVSMITGGLTAKGHGLEVDATTLKQIHACARKMGQVPVKTNHGTGVDAVNGYLTNFRIDADKVRGDWTMLQSYQQTPHLLEMAEKMPGCIGLSVAFRGDPETAKGEKVFFDEKTKKPYTLGKAGNQVNLAAGEKIYARCEELVSTDLVASPAANPDGMFSARVDKPVNGMAKTNLTPEGAPGAAAEEAAPAWAQKLIDSVASIHERIEALEGPGAEEEGEEGEEYTDEQIDALIASGKAVQQKDGTVVWADGGEAEDDEDGVVDEAEDAGDEVEHHEQAAEAALGRQDLVTYFDRKNKALESRFNQFELRLAGEKAAKAKRAEATALAAIETKFDAICKQNETLLEQNKAQAELIHEFQEGGGGKSRTSTSAAELTMFSEQGLEASEEEGVTQFEANVNKHFIKLQSNTSLSEWGRKAEATRLAIAENPKAYETHLAEGGIRQPVKRR